MVDLFPEADEVVNRGDDGNNSHPVDSGDGDKVNADDEATVEVGEPEPIIPPVGQDGGNDGDNLDNGFEFADLTGLDGEALRGGNGTQP